MVQIRKTTVGQLLIDASLPKAMRGRNLSLTSKSVADLLQEVAEKYPDQYVSVSKKLSDLGRHAATTSNGYSVGLEHLGRGENTKRLFNDFSNELQQTYAQELPKAEQSKRIVEIGLKYRTPLQDVLFNEAEAENNPMALQIISGARGSKSNLASLAGSDMLYTDYKDRPIPIPIMRSYAQGLSPAEYFAGAFGARRGVVDTKLSTAKAGFMLKQLSQTSHRLVVTARDSEEPHDPESIRGFPVDTSSKYNAGSLLAHDAGGYKRNTILTPKILKELSNSGIPRILVRSPIVGGPADGGVYAYDAGVRERGSLAPIGDFVGLAGAQAIGEPLSQSMLSSKHCLAAGTLVRMADFSVKPIELIRIGDEVLGADKTGRTFAVSVTNVFDNGLRECVSSLFKTEDFQATLICTADHKLLTTDQVAVPLWNCYAVKLADKTSGIIRITGRVGDKPTHDIEVDHPDHLFVLANGLIVSNSGGAAGATAGAVGGFALFNSMIQVPETFPGRATHSQVDGRVKSINAAQQGGHYVTIGSQDHYVPGDLSPLVKPGDMIEAGDVLSSGTPNPAEITQHKGIGEGRKYFVDTFLREMENSGTKVHRRNVELLARGLINHVRLTEEHDDYVPDDLVPYQSLESSWQPRAGHAVLAPHQAQGWYLEKPAMHYSIGTPIRPSVISNLKEFGVNKIYAHKSPPPFKSEMVRAMGAAHEDPDWMTRMLGSYQKDSLLEAAHHGAVSDTSGTSYVPALAKGKTFGQTGLTKAWDPSENTDILD